MKHFLLFYDVSDDYLARRGEFREVHLAHAWRAVERGELLLAGATTDPDEAVDGAVLLFEAPSADVPVRFAETDPYVTSGIVTAWRVRGWTTVAGEESSTPVRPGCS
jgi:uncharacterized protein